MLLEFATVPSSWNSEKYSTNYYYDAIYGCHDGWVMNRKTNAMESVKIINGICNNTDPNVGYNENAIFPRSEVYPGSEGLYLAILLAILIGFRLIAMWTLDRRAARA